nr:hypothetical protein [Bdellovibrionales bacterium]
DLEVSARKQFTFSFDKNKLILRDGITTLVLVRTDGVNEKSLIGSWAMQEILGKVTTVTELIFKDLNDITIHKTCKLK